MVDRSVRQLQFGFGALVATVVMGTIGYMVIEQWDLLDALYMTVIAVTTTGFKEVHTLSDGGRLFTLFVIVLGVGSIAYTGGRGVQVLLEAQILRKRRMDRRLAALENHCIVCGYGKMGRYICEELAERGERFAVIERDPSRIEIIRELGYLFVDGDATEDDTLAKARIAGARGLVAVLSSDADNVFATLSAKSLNPKIFVVAARWRRKPIPSSGRRAPIAWSSRTRPPG